MNDCNLKLESFKMAKLEKKLMIVNNVLINNKNHVHDRLVYIMKTKI